MLHRQGQSDEALARLRTTLVAHPEHGASLRYQGVILLARGDLDGAQRSFEAALAADPADLAALRSLGLLLLYHRGDAPRARPLLERWVRARLALPAPVSANGYRDAGVACLFSNRTDAAIRYLTRALKLEPQRAELHFHLGVAFLQGEEFPTARQHLYASMLGRLLVRMRKYADAVPVLQGVVAQSPEDADAWMALGLAHDAQKHTAEAFAAYAKACALGQQDACVPGR